MHLATAGGTLDLQHVSIFAAGVPGAGRLDDLQGVAAMCARRRRRHQLRHPRRLQGHPRQDWHRVPAQGEPEMGRKPSCIGWSGATMNRRRNSEYRGREPSAAYNAPTDAPLRDSTASRCWRCCLPEVAAVLMRCIILHADLQDSQAAGHNRAARLGGRRQLDAAVVALQAVCRQAPGGQESPGLF